MVRKQGLRKWIAVVPALLFLFIFFFFPIGALISSSLFDPDFTLRNYANFTSETVYVAIIWNTIKIAALVTLFTLIVGYPLAYIIYKNQGWKRILLLGVILLPFWTNVLVRNFALIFLLQREGVINKFFISLHIINEPLPLLYNLIGVAIGMTYVLLPYMVLPITAAMDSINPIVEKSARSLGAGELRSFISIVLPLSLPGVAAGVSLVFLISLGFFVTPALLGGKRELMLSMAIAIQVNELLNFGFAAALETVLLLLTIIVGGILGLLSWFIKSHYIKLWRII